MALSETTPQPQVTTPEGRVEPLTGIEREILDFMVQYLRSNTYQPSIREIGRRFGIKSTKTVSEHLQVLAEKGFLERDSSRSRGVKILGIDLNTQAVSVPCFNRVPDPISEFRIEDAEVHLSVDRRMGGEEGSFIVVAGVNDLALLGVVEGDYILISPTSIENLEDGAIIVADFGEGASYHRLTRNETGVKLESLRPGNEETRVVEPATIESLGRVSGLYRRMDDGAKVNLTQH
ncbi:MAG TPA: hypothetical protein EYO83_14195 [Gemmatimonadetes bacterium]|nr:hypothetical protein [Gemmatimonadota bacterium]